jgi:predicted DNA-binding ribbon-helix-helix protein
MTAALGCVNESRMAGNGGEASTSKFDGGEMKSLVIKRSIVIDGVKTSVSVEDTFWLDLREIAREKALTISALVSSIKATRAENSNLSSAIRVYVLSHIRERLSALLHAGEVGRSVVAERQALDVPS